MKDINNRRVGDDHACREVELHQLKEVALFAGGASRHVLQEERPEKEVKIIQIEIVNYEWLNQ